MSEFDDFTKKLSEEHARKTQAKAERDKREREDRHALYDKGKAALESNVVPLIADANKACEAQGVRMVASNNWSEGYITTPTIELQVFGQKQRPHHDSTYEVHGHKVTISHDGEDFSAGVRNKALHAEQGGDYKGRGIGAVNMVIKIAISSLYEELSPDH